MFIPFTSIEKVLLSPFAGKECVRAVVTTQGNQQVAMTHLVVVRGGPTLGEEFPHGWPPQSVSLLKKTTGKRSKNR